MAALETHSKDAKHPGASVSVASVTLGDSLLSEVQLLQRHLGAGKSFETRAVQQAIASLASLRKLKSSGTGVRQERGGGGRGR